MKINKQGLIVGLVFYAFILFCWICTNTFVGDASIFPRMILALLALLNTIMIIQAFRGQGKSAFSAKEAAMPLLFFAGIVAYVLLFTLLGYFPSTCIMLIAYMLILKVRPYWLIAALTAGYLAFVYVLFVVWLNTNIV